MKLTFQWFGFSSPQMHAALDIRTKVFVDEQGYTLEDDRDEQDKTALHVLGYDAAGVPVCTARMVERESFYAALGFSPVGEVFLDCGQPHIEMQKAL